MPGTHQGTLHLVMRPERIRLVTEIGGVQVSSIGLPAEVRSVTDRGVFLRVELDASFPLVAHVTYERAADLALEWGTKVTASIRPESVHVIPPARRDAAPNLPLSR